MSVQAHLARRPRPSAKADGGFLYGWLLLALFIEYARPTNQLAFLNFPFFYSIVPLSLLAVASLVPGMRSLKSASQDPLTKWVFIYVALIIVSAVLTGADSHAMNVATMAVGYMFFFVIILRLVTTIQRIRGVVVALMIAHLYLLAMNIEVVTVGDRSHYLDGGTFLGDGNDFSLSLCLLLPLVIEVALSARALLYRVIVWSGVAAIILAIVATQSRGGTLALAGVFGYLWLRSSKKLLALFGVLLVVAMIFVYSPPGYFERMSMLTSGEIDGSAQGRIDAWKAAIGMVAHNPIFGIGVGQFAPRWGRTAHSTYFLAMAELGLPGIVCVVVLVFGNLRASNRLRLQLLTRAGQLSRPEVLRHAKLLDLMVASIIGFAIAGSFLSASYNPHIFILSGLAISARLVIGQRYKLSPTDQARPGGRVGECSPIRPPNRQDEFGKTFPNAN